ncbi:kelch-like protein 10 [Zootermopsis nevadensis]|uniref:kelch-like protein 10 n=1 Tax=Zootermopsis nevadensis TaxID=136037 RepID=UPI000B8E52F9|nr:kelch-like protein 10 [Zootermopsis nevadensis]
MRFKRQGHSCVVFRGSLYVLGGYSDTRDALNTEKYDPENNTWTEIPDMNYHSTCLKAEVIDDTLFIIDGFLKKCIAYSDDKENRWYQAKKYNVCRFGMSICVVKDLPNAKDYAYKHTDKLMEGKRKREGGETQGKKDQKRRKRRINIEMLDLENQ